MAAKILNGVIAGKGVISVVAIVFEILKGNFATT